MEPVDSQPPIWWRAERRSRGPAPALDRRAIAAAAIALADAGGLDAVSMRAVAHQLATSGSALYRYVDGRSELLDLMSDQVVAELRPYAAPGGAWLESMVALAAAQRSLHERHRWLITLGHRRSGIGPETLGYFDTCLSLMAATGAPARAKFEAIAMMTGLAALFAQQAQSEELGGVTIFPPSALGSFPQLAEALAEREAPPVRDDLFERAVRSLLLGLLEA